MNDIVILHLSDLHIDSSSTNYSRLLRGLLIDIKKKSYWFQIIVLLLQ